MVFYFSALMDLRQANSIRFSALVIEMHINTIMLLPLFILVHDLTLQYYRDLTTIYIGTITILPLFILILFVL